MKNFKDHLDEAIFDQWVDSLSIEEIDEVMEEVDIEENPRVQKISRKDSMQSKRDYKKDKGKLKREREKYKKSSKYKMYLKKKKIMSKRGRTSSGELIRKKKVV
jgi:hypothetical protein